MCALCFLVTRLTINNWTLRIRYTFFPVSRSLLYLYLQLVTSKGSPILHCCTTKIITLRDLSAGAVKRVSFSLRTNPWDNFYWSPRRCQLSNELPSFFPPKSKGHNSLNYHGDSSEAKVRDVVEIWHFVVETRGPLSLFYDAPMHPNRNPTLLSSDPRSRFHSAFFFRAHRRILCFSRSSRLVAMRCRDPLKQEYFFMVHQIGKSGAAPRREKRNVGRREVWMRVP